MHIGLDWSNFQPRLTPELATQFASGFGFTRFLVQTQFPQAFQPAAAALVQAHLGLDAVRYLYNSQDYGEQIQQASQQIYKASADSGAATRYLDLDFEDSYGDLTTARQRLRDAITGYGGATPLRIYTSLGYWQATEDGKGWPFVLPFRLAQWDGIADLPLGVLPGPTDAKQYLGTTTINGILVSVNLLADSFR